MVFFGWSSSVDLVGVWMLQLLTLWCQLCVAFCTILIASYLTGWLHRLLWFLAEREAKKILNGATVTSSTFQVDLLRGKVWISNIVVHSPKQDVWHWEAPVFARIGKLYVEANLVSCIFSLWFLHEELPLDFYTILLSDIQVFIERKHNIYNFLLLDPHVIIPATPQLLHTTSENVHEDDDVVFVPAAGDFSRNLHPDGSDSSETIAMNLPPDNCPNESMLSESNNSRKNDDEDKAQQVLEHIVHSVRRASVVGGKKNPVESLLDQYRHTLTNHLKAFTTKTDVSPGKKTSTTAMMQESVNIIKSVTANIAEKTVQAQQVIVPARRVVPGERPVYGRVGRVFIQDMRIFVHENPRFNLTGTGTSTSSTSFVDFNENTGTSSNLEKGVNKASPSVSSWHPPIVIHRVSIRANEFCPPLIAKESRIRLQSQKLNMVFEPKFLSKEYNEIVLDYDPKHMPALYQTMDVFADIVWKRVLAEVAKSRTGQFFQTAMGEVVTLFVESNDALQEDIDTS
jgi:hypothetical protein